MDAAGHKGRNDGTDDGVDAERVQTFCNDVTDPRSDDTADNRLTQSFFDSGSGDGLQ